MLQLCVVAALSVAVSSISLLLLAAMEALVAAYDQKASDKVAKSVLIIYLVLAAALGVRLPASLNTLAVGSSICSTSLLSV